LTPEVVPLVIGCEFSQVINNNSKLQGYLYISECHHHRTLKHIIKHAEYILINKSPLKTLQHEMRLFLLLTAIQHRNIDKYVEL